MIFKSAVEHLDFTLRTDRTNILRRNIKRGAVISALSAATFALCGCHMAVMDPKGPIGAQEKDIILLATGLMLLVVIPVIVMTLWFAWQYRASNRAADYAPDWEHSNRIEAVVWAVPCLIILALGSVTWVSTHKLDPRVPIASATKPVEVEVVSLNWKWLFIYPQYGVASVNEMALPVGTPVHFKLTSATVMNSFFIPELGSQIYTMTGMETQLSLRADRPGVYDGMSANYSGGGFGNMQFKAIATDQAGFDAWIGKARASQAALDAGAYMTLAVPGKAEANAIEPVHYYAVVSPTLYHNILNKCANGAICTDDAVNMAVMQHVAPGAKSCKPSKDAGKTEKAPEVALIPAAPRTAGGRRS